MGQYQYFLSAVNGCHGNDLSWCPVLSNFVSYMHQG